MMEKREKYCVMCGKKFSLFRKANAPGLGMRTIKSKRPSSSVTCSKRCSIMYISLTKKEKEAVKKKAEEKDRREKKNILEKKKKISIRDKLMLDLILMFIISFCIEEIVFGPVLKLGGFLL